MNVAHLELVAIVDADTLLERDALKRIAEVFAADPDNVVAAGGSIRVANGAVIEGNAVAVPTSPTAARRQRRPASICAASSALGSPGRR